MNVLKGAVQNFAPSSPFVQLIALKLQRRANDRILGAKSRRQWDSVEAMPAGLSLVL